MKKLGNVREAMKLITACICIIAVVFAYTLSASAATTMIKSGTEVSGTLKNGKSKTYELKVSKTTKFNLTAEAEVIVDESEDEEDVEVEEEEEDVEDVEDESYETEGEEYDESTDIMDETADDEDMEETDEEEVAYEDEGDDESEIVEYITLEITKGKKKVLKALKVEDCDSKSKTVTLKAGTYKVKVSAVADTNISYKVLLQDKATAKASSKKAATKINVTKKKTLKAGKNFTVKVKGNGSLGKLTYKTSDKKVAKVNAKGKVTAVGKGTCKITVKMKGVKKAAVCKITVKK